MREIYIIALRPEPHTDPIRNLRRGLKYLLRVCHLRAVRVEEYPAAHAVEPVRSPTQNRDGLCVPRTSSSEFLQANPSSCVKIPCSSETTPCSVALRI
jgi:hypothetical protein